MRAPPRVPPTPGPTHTRSHPHVVSTHGNIMASPLPFSFASVRAPTQDPRDILKWGALSLPTELPQLVVRVPFYCESTTPGPTHTLSHPHVVSTHGNIMASPLPFYFASIRARTQDHRDILKWGALSLPTELTQLVVRVLPISMMSLWS